VGLVEALKIVRKMSCSLSEAWSLDQEECLLSQ
jgi:hypothetical protein